MAEGHFISGLKQRRAEHLGRLQQLRDEIANLEAEERELLDTLGHVDALLRIEAPDLRLDLIKPRKPRDPKRVATSKGRGGVPITKAVLRLLRIEGSGMTVEEIAERLSSDYPELERKKLVQNIRIFLSARKGSGTLVTDEGRPLRYAIPPLAKVA